MSLPPPYYASAAALEAQHRDAASLIRQLSQDVVQTNESFSQVSSLLGGQQGIEGSSGSLKNEWDTVQKGFQSVIWAARTAATQVQARNGEFIEVIIPVVGDADETKDSKLAEIRAFLSRKMPVFLTSDEASKKIQEVKNSLDSVIKKCGEDSDRMVATAHADIAKLEEEREKEKVKRETAPKRSGYSLFGGSKASESSAPDPVDYDTKIARARDTIETINKQRDEIQAKATEIRHALNTIPDQVGNCFSAVWTHLTTDATHLKNRLEGSTTGPMPDLAMITRVYTEINSSLKYYATNVTTMRP